MNNNWGREREEKDYVEVTAKCVVIKRIIKSQLSTALCKPGIEWAEAEKKQLKSVHMTVKYPVIYAPMRYTSFASSFPCFNELNLFPHFFIFHIFEVFVIKNN